MRFFNLDKFVEVNARPYVDDILSLSITVAAEGFTGNGGCEIWRSDLGKFNQDLKRLEATRSGEIILKTIHPDSFRFGLTVINRRRDIVIHGQITSLGVEIYGDFHNALQFAFELDLEHFWQSVQSFDEMVSNIK